MLKQKGIEKGVISEREADTMSDKEAFGIIFKPGFSTAATISNVSGRGVGMDVVKTNIEKLNGIIDIESEKGVGTTQKLKIPLVLLQLSKHCLLLCKKEILCYSTFVIETVA